jgi:hypothetical protein
MSLRQRSKVGPSAHSASPSCRLTLFVLISPKGPGPQRVARRDIVRVFKFETHCKSFTEIHTRTLGTTVAAIAVRPAAVARAHERW